MRMLLSARLWLAWMVLRGRVEAMNYSVQLGRPDRLTIDLSGGHAWQFEHRMRKGNP